MESKQLNIIMYPWLAMGHVIPYFQLGLKLAEKGHKITLLLPNKAKLMLPFSSNINPNLTFHIITIPHVHPLPLDTQLNSEIPFHLETHLATALDRTRPEFESILATLQPNIIIYDFAYWIPEVITTSGSNAKCVTYLPVALTSIAIGIVANQKIVGNSSLPIAQETKTDYSGLYMPYGEGVTFLERIKIGIDGCKVIAVKSCREIEGEFCEFLSDYYKKPILLPGAFPDENTELDARWADWLAQFSPSSVVFCSLGSQVVLDVAQFQELLLGFEMTKLPFFVAIKPPTGYTTVDEAFPEGYAERVRERGMVTHEWVPQPQIVSHPSVGCFVNHCGSGSVWEALFSRNQIVLMPQMVDQVEFSRYLAQELKVAVQVERGEDGSWVSKESLCEAINNVMDANNEIGNIVKRNHEMYRQKLSKPGLMNDYIDHFIKDLQVLLNSNCHIQ